MINVCYFERLLNVNLFEQVLTEGGGIALSRVGPEMADADVAAALTGIQGYHTRGGSQLVPPKFRIDKDFIAKCPNLIAVCTGGAGYERACRFRAVMPMSRRHEVWTLEMPVWSVEPLPPPRLPAARRRGAP